MNSFRAGLHEGPPRQLIMPRNAIILAVVLSLVVLLGVVVAGYAGRGRSMAALEEQLAAARGEMRAAVASASSNLSLWTAVTGEVALARLRIEALEADKAALARENESIAARQQSLETEMRQALESRDITISELQGRLTVDILDRVLFDSGEATLKPEGEAVLRRVAAVLAQFPDRQVHVVGHTDDVPIRSSPRSCIPTNWELSAARALAAVRFLTEQAGVEAGRLGAVAYGEYRPIADNATPEGRARNRRIALVVLSEELAGSDRGLTNRAAVRPDASSTNLPPGLAPLPVSGPAAVSNVPPVIGAPPAAP